MALRLVIETDGEKFRLVRQDRIDMVPPMPPAPVEQHRAGIYAELRDANDGPLYQQLITPQLEPTMEVFSEEGSMQRVTDERRTRIIMLVVPDAGARSVAFLRTRPPSTGVVETHAGPEELARISLDEAP